MSNSLRITDEQYPVNVEFPPFVQGGDWYWSIQLMQDDNVTPINTTGYAMEFEIRNGQNGEVYDLLTIGDGIVMTAASGLFTVGIPAVVINSYDWSSAKAKVIVTDNLGNKTPYFIGDLKFVA